MGSSAVCFQRFAPRACRWRPRFGRGDCEHREPRARARGKELAIRVSVGASGPRLIRQLLLESVVLGLAGAVAGAVVAHWASRMLVFHLSTERTAAFLDMNVGMLALTLAAVGLAGLVSYSVTRRRTELGIRSALGATPGGLVSLVLREVALVTAVGLVVGAAVSLTSGRLVASLLYGLDAGDIRTIVASAAALAIVAAVAGFVPARRAGRGEMMVSLKSE